MIGLHEIANFEKTIKANFAMSHAVATLVSLTLDERGPQPLHRQLFYALKQRILTGAFAPGARLPASRTLAGELGVSRTTVVTAIDQLVAEGYLVARRGAGVYVARDLPEQGLMPPARALPPRAGTPAPPSPPRPFAAAAPDHRLFPHERWAKALYQAWREPAADLLGGEQAAGLWSLRRAIAAHLAAWRGISCAPDQVFITCGALEASQRIAAACLQPGDRVAMEDPGYPLMARSFAAMGNPVVDIAVDDDGLDVDALSAHHGLKACVVTPSRQYPLGQTLSLARRLALLAWARDSGGIVVEDDYDSEYRYRGSPLPALYGLDGDEVVIYAGSFSKSLSKALRLGFLVVPDRLRQNFAADYAASGPMASLLPQAGLANFMASGEFATHLRRTRKAYGERHRCLVDAVDHHLADWLEIQPRPSGMHLCARLTRQARRLGDDTMLSRLARRAGITASPLSPFYRSAPAQQGLLLGFAGFTGEEIAVACASLAQVFIAAGSRSDRWPDRRH